MVEFADDMALIANTANAKWITSSEKNCLDKRMAKTAVQDEQKWCNICQDLYTER